MSSQLLANGSRKISLSAVIVLILMLLLLASSSYAVAAGPVIQGPSPKPTVRILFPENATALEVSATYTVNISATDENAISQVKIKIAGPESTKGWVTIVKIGNHYCHNWTVNTVGNYSITARAINIDGKHADDFVEVEVVADEQPLEEVHDVAVTSVTPSLTEVTAGEIVAIMVVVENQGTETETFDVTAYGSAVIGTQKVTNLTAGSSQNLTFNWNTSTVNPGTYTIKAVASTVTGENDTVDNTYFNGTVTINPVPEPPQPPQPPTASFNFTPSGPTVNESIVFDASASYALDGTIVSYAWDFGDGTTATETNPVTVHRFTEAGTYKVSLTVFDDNGLNATGEHDNVTVKKITSTLVINATPLTITTNSSVTISGYVFPARSYVTVTISYRAEGTDWETLATIVTNIAGHFSYEWTPTLEGTYEFKAEWNGDANTQADESEICSVTVQKAASQQTTNNNADSNEDGNPNNGNNNLTYIFSGVGIAAIALTALLILFAKKKKSIGGPGRT